MSRCPLGLAGWAAGLFGLAFSAVAVGDEILNIGDAPPALAVSSWVKGDKLESFEPGKTYVVEFWATWCGPCRASIPHLTELAHKYKDKGIAFVGVDVWENDTSKVQPFVDEMGEKMDYSVALDTVAEGGNDRGAMATTWMTAAEEHGIPTAFVVSDGKIAWIGHPMSLDEPLTKITEGKWDFAELAQKRLTEKRLEHEMSEVRREVYTPYQAKDYQTTLTAIDEAAKKFPDLADKFDPIKFASLCNSGQVDAGVELGEKLLEKYNDSASGLNHVFWDVLDPDRVENVDPRVAQLAVKGMSRAVELTKEEDPNVLDTLAEAQFRAGDVATAVETQEKAIKVVEAKGLPPQYLQVFKDRLERFRQAAPKSEETTEKQ